MKIIVVEVRQKMNDYISRQAAIDEILHNQEVYSNNFGDDPIDKYTIAIIDNDAQTIAQLPSADRPQGEWIAKTEKYLSYWACSECEAWALLDYNEQMCLSNFCPNCGARMKGADDEID